MASTSRRTAPAEVDGLSLPVGFRFHPTEHELVSYYLVKKIQGLDSDVSHIIREIDICKHEPWELPAFSLIKSDDEEWFFFSRPDYKQNNRNRTNRSTTEGYWKITGKERVIKARDNRTVVGKKRTMTFYRGRVRDAQKTNWVIHEYYIPEKQRDFVLCRLKKKSDEKNDVATCDDGEPSTYNASDFENQLAQNMEIPEDTQPLENLDYFETVKALLLGNVDSTNENYELQSEFGAIETDAAYETDEEFVNSIIVDPDQEKTYSTTVPESFRRLYVADGGVSSKKVMMIRRDTDVMLRDPILSPTASFLAGMFVLGAVLFVIFAREEFLYGTWC